MTRRSMSAPDTAASPSSTPAIRLRPAWSARPIPPGSALQVSFADDHLYVADWNDMRVFEVSDGSAPTLVTYRALAAGRWALRGFAVWRRTGSTVFIGEWDRSLRLRAPPGAAWPRTSAPAPSTCVSSTSTPEPRRRRRSWSTTTEPRRWSRWSRSPATLLPPMYNRSNWRLARSVSSR